MAIITTDTLKFREYVGDAWKNLLLQANMDFNLIYPVGSIYISTDSTNPATLFGGTWERITGVFLLGGTDGGAAGGNSNANIAPGYTGGEATHKLTDTEMPVHNGHIASSVTGGNLKAYLNKNTLTSYGSIGRGWWEMAGNEAYPVSQNRGGGGVHNNMPPYLAVYMWKRLTLAPHLPYPQNVLGDIASVSTAFAIPASGSSISYDMAGITSDYMLVKWNFSASPENRPPVDLSCTTYNGYFTVTNNGGTTSETIKPLFIKAKEVTITSH